MTTTPATDGAPSTIRQNQFDALCDMSDQTKSTVFNMVWGYLSYSEKIGGRADPTALLDFLYKHALDNELRYGQKSTSNHE